MVFYLLCKILVPILDTVYLAEIINGKKKRNIFNCFQFWSQEAQKEKRITILFGDLPWGILLFMGYPRGNIGSSVIFPGETEGSKQSTIIYVLVSLKFSMRTACQTLILSFLVPFLIFTPHFYGALLVVALITLFSHYSQNPF